MLGLRKKSDLAPGDPGWLDTQVAKQDDPSELAPASPGPVQVATGESYPTLSGYAPGSYPEAQANGQQFDNPDAVSAVRTGKQEEALARELGS
jgi:hypothetical protein